MIVENLRKKKTKRFRTFTETRSGFRDLTSKKNVLYLLVKISRPDKKLTLKTVPAFLKLKPLFM